MSTFRQSSYFITEQFVLTNQDVHFWSVPLTCGEFNLESLQSLLSSDERVRAHQFRFPIHRRRFIVCHAALRMILSSYSNVPACDIFFQVNSYGKPELDPSLGKDLLYFNLSHSDELALIAISRGGPLGVDIERIHPLPDLEDIAARFFSPAEQAAILQLPSDQRLRAFYRCWTSKEAFIKAIGLGLQFDLNRFDVSVSPSGPPALLCIDNDPEKAQAWFITNVAVEDGYMGTFVGAKRPGQMFNHRWVAPHACQKSGS